MHRFTFKRVIEHQDIIDYFSGIMKNDRLHHAYLFIGEEGVGKFAMAMEWARALHCMHSEVRPCYECSNCRKISELKHPDVMAYAPTPPGGKKEDTLYEAMTGMRQRLAKNPYARVVISPAWQFRIHWIKEIINLTALKRVDDGIRIFILIHVEQMNPEAANMFLKTLEEPPPGVLFILTCADASNILPTIRSRCISVLFPPLPEDAVIKALGENYGLPKEEAHLCAALSGGSLTRAVENMESKLSVKHEWASRLMQAAGSSKIEHIVDFAAEFTKLNSEIPVRDILQLFLYYIRRAIINKEMVNNSSPHIDSEHREEISPLFSGLDILPAGCLWEVATEVEKSIDFMDKNVYLDLIILNLLQNIRKAVRARGYT